MQVTRYAVTKPYESGGRLPALVCAAVLILCLAACREARSPSVTQHEADRIGSVYLEARNTARLDLLDQIYDPDVVVHDCSAPETIRGLEALKSYYRESHEGLPDFRAEFDDLFVSGEKIVFLWTITATHTGTLRGLPPTGRTLRFSGVAIDRIAGGRIVEEWVYFDASDLMRQLGFSFVPPAAGTD